MGHIDQSWRSGSVLALPCSGVFGWIDRSAGRAVGSDPLTESVAIAVGGLLGGESEVGPEVEPILPVTIKQPE